MSATYSSGHYWVAAPPAGHGTGPTDRDHCECGAEPPDGLTSYERWEWYVGHRRRVAQLTRRVTDRPLLRLRLLYQQRAALDREIAALRSDLSLEPACPYRYGLTP